VPRWCCRKTTQRGKRGEEKQEKGTLPFFTMLPIDTVPPSPAHHQRVAVFQSHFELFARLHHGGRLSFYPVICPAFPNVVCLMVLSLLLGEGKLFVPFLEYYRYWQIDRAVSSVIFLLKEINDLMSKEGASHSYNALSGPRSDKIEFVSEQSALQTQLVVSLQA
jgi:hypothetical protein